MVSDSCTMRAAATSITAGSAAVRPARPSSPLSPVARAVPTRPSRSAMPGVGAVGCPCSARSAVDQRVHIRNRLPARVFDRGERWAGTLRVLFEQFERHRRLHVDHRKAVGQHVVQLPGDGQPLLRGPSLLLGLRLAGHRGLALTAGVDHRATLPDTLGDRDEHQSARPRCRCWPPRAAGVATASGISHTTPPSPAPAADRSATATRRRRGQERHDQRREYRARPETAAW